MLWKPTMTNPTPRRSLGSRLKMMLGHTWLMLIALGCIAIGIGAIVYRVSTEPLWLQIAVGPEGSEDVKIVQALASQLGRDSASLRLKVNVTGGTEESAAAIEKGTADLAVVRRDVAMPRDGLAVAILRRNVVVLFAPVAPPAPPAAPAAKGKDAKSAKDAKKAKTAKAKAKAKADEDEEEEEKKKAPIEKIAELSGKRIGIIGRTRANATILDVILRQYGIAADKVTVETLRVDDSTPIKEGKVDAVMAVGPVGSRITADAILAATRGKDPPAFISIGAAEAIAERHPIYEATEIKAGAFGGSPPQPEEALDTISVNHYVVARKDLSEQTIADLARLIYSARQVVATEFPGAAKIEAPETGKSSVVTVHPGAAAYIDGTQKNFFERYSDFIYMAVLLLSVAGSGLAGLMSFSKAGEREQRLHKLDRLIALIAQARAAKSGEDLDRLTAEADEILRTTLQQAEKDSLDQSALGAFSLALDQARRAIAERRGMLVSAPPTVTAEERQERPFEVGPPGRASS
jgi:TRAP-type uncharacterized transport system substrate-binding protein